MPKLKEECAIVGIFSKENSNVINEIKFCLQKLQHRGQDSVGISFLKNNEIEVRKNTTLVKDFDFKNINSNLIIGHTRYATTGDISVLNAQPVKFKGVSLCFNGTIKNSSNYKKELISNGFKIETTSDSEIILKWLFYKLKKEPALWDAAEINDILKNDFNNKAFSLLLMFKDKIMAFKDKNSYRPLIFVETEKSYYFLSEDCIKDEKVINKFELKASSSLVVDKKGFKYFKNENKETKKCVFEIIYFAKNNVFNCDIKQKRKKLGSILALYDKNLDNVDFIVPVMNSGYLGAIGYSEEKKLPLKILIKNRENVLRTFIEKEEKRNQKLDEKYVFNEKKLKGKNIVLVDDSIVRGSTSKKIIQKLKESGVKDIHLRLTSPMIISPCFWGVDIPNEEELLAYKLKTEDNIKKELNIKSVKFIKLQDFEKEFNKNEWCYNCLVNTHTKNQA